MRRPLSVAVVSALLLSACQANLPTKKPTPVKPTGGAAQVATPDLPPGPTVALRGQFQLDASYAVSAGGANVVSAGGANVVSAGGANLIKVGGLVISAGGANVVSAGGANVVSAGGGNVVSAGGANFRLLGIEVAFGAVLPAAGMAVVPVSLQTGKVIGAAVLTNDQGQFQVRIPEAETGNVRLVAAVPGKNARDPVLDDPRLQYALLTHPTSAEAANVIDEDTTLVTHFMRLGFADRLDDLLKARTVTQWENELSSWLERGSSKELILPLIKGMTDGMLAAKTYQLSDAKRLALALRLADSVMYYTDFDKAMVDRTSPAFAGLAEEKAVSALREMLKLLREGTNRKYGANLAAFGENGFVKAINQARPAPYTFKKSTDIGEFAVSETMSLNEQGQRYFDLNLLFEALDVDKAQVPRLKAAQFGLLMTIAQTMFLNTDAKQAFMAIIEEAAKDVSAP